MIALLLSIAEIFALGLMLVALLPSQTVASAVSGGVIFVLMFLSGLWVQPAQVGDPLRTIVYYSPSGGGKGSARCGLHQQPFLYGAAHHGHLHSHVRIHSDSLFPLGVARLPRPGDIKDKGQIFLQPFPCKVLWRKALNC